MIRTLNSPADNGALCIELRVQEKFFAGLYMSGGIALNDFMSPGELVVIVLGCILLVVAGIKLATKLFSDDARWSAVVVAAMRLSPPSRIAPRSGSA